VPFRCPLGRRRRHDHYSRCYNVAEGFEGDPDGERHRGAHNGWKAAGLPWVQT
jgi:hypothetical protein